MQIERTKEVDLRSPKQSDRILSWSRFLVVSLIENREAKVHPLGIFLYLFRQGSEDEDVSYPTTPDVIFPTEVSRETVETFIPSDSVGYLLTTIGDVLAGPAEEPVQWSESSEEQKKTMLLSVPAQYTTAQADWFFIASLETRDTSKTYCAPFLKDKFSWIEEVSHTSVGVLGGLGTANSWS